MNQLEDLKTLELPLLPQNNYFELSGFTNFLENRLRVYHLIYLKSSFHTIIAKFKKQSKVGKYVLCRSKSLRIVTKVNDACYRVPHGQIVFKHSMFVSYLMVKNSLMKLSSLEFMRDSLLM